MDDGQLAAALLPLLGGARNVTRASACATRLRCTLRDPARADDEAIVALPGVRIVLEQAGQVQIVLGPRSAPVARALTTLLRG